ncbi:MAG: hypothetical protein LBE12_05600, partial [Planctomycetaceae bacterium]|nr:hypothetical protein [Planctomycetaceae bacterium]
MRHYPLSTISPTLLLIAPLGRIGTQFFDSKTKITRIDYKKTIYNKIEHRLPNFLFFSIFVLIFMAGV